VLRLAIWVESVYLLPWVRVLFLIRSLVGLTMSSRGDGMPRALLAAVMTVLLLPGIASAVDFFCPESAFACSDPADLSTCTVPVALQRQTPDQVILRQVVVQEGPFTNVELALLCSDVVDDGVFTSARDRLCVPPPPPVTPPGETPSTPQPTGGPGLIGGNPGLVGGNPGLVGGNPGISIRR
jgi:hypothetical protein